MKPCFSLNRLIIPVSNTAGHKCVGIIKLPACFQLHITENKPLCPAHNDANFFRRTVCPEFKRFAATFFKRLYGVLHKRTIFFFCEQPYCYFLFHIHHFIFPVPRFKRVVNSGMLRRPRWSCRASAYRPSQSTERGHRAVQSARLSGRRSQP